MLFLFSKMKLWFFNSDHYFKAGLCKLWYNGENAHSKFNIYCEEFPAFFGTREAQLLAELIAAVNNSDFGEFTKEHVKIFIFYCGIVGGAFYKGPN